MNTVLETATSLAPACPIHAGDDASVRMDDVLTLAMPKRIIVQYAENDEGQTELRLFYGDKEVSFDEPHLFAFGETLARQSTFQAGDAMRWGDGYGWDVVAPLLDTLIEEEILERGQPDACPVPPAVDRTRPSPLPPARAVRARTWDECAAITQEITGRAVDPAHLELVIPIFRVAHMALDADGRQVGEANVFPRALRLEAPTDWIACIYPGTRYMAERPMNVTALKAMRTHWDQMMAALRHIRTHYLTRYPDARNGWTLGHLERLATLVLAVPTYQLVRQDRPLQPGQLHPALSSLFRVTDGLRMTMHQMLFVPIGEPTLPYDTVLTSGKIYDYAERNYTFHSETGVCAGPKHMVQMFLNVLVDGQGSDDEPFEFDDAVAAALGNIDAAFDYGLHGLRAHVALFGLWPIMTRCYEALAATIEAGAAAGAPGFEPLHDRMQQRISELKRGTYLGSESWRADREHVYAAIYKTCGEGIAQTSRASLLDRLAEARPTEVESLVSDIGAVLRMRTGSSNSYVEDLARALAHFAADTQAILRVADASQRDINALLGRKPASRAFEADDANVYNLLQEAQRQPLAFLTDELRAAFGLSLTIATDRLEAVAVAGT